MKAEEEKRAKRRARERVWREANKERINAAKRQRRDADPEKHKAAVQRWRKANPDKVREGVRAWRDANPEHWSFIGFMYRQRNPEKSAARREAYKANNPEKHRRQQNGRPSAKRARVRSNRRRAIVAIKDKAALGERIIARARGFLPKNLPAGIRDGAVSLVAEWVYSGKIAIRFTEAEATEALRAHRAAVEHFQLQHRSLDAPILDDGSGSLHDTVSVGLWS